MEAIGHRTSVVTHQQGLRSWMNLVQQECIDQCHWILKVVMMPNMIFYLIDDCGNNLKFTRQGTNSHCCRPTEQQIERMKDANFNTEKENSFVESITENMKQHIELS